MALSNCQAPWPAFVPVHDALRDAYWGVAAVGRSSVFFNTDSIHTSSALPQGLLEVHRMCLPCRVVEGFSTFL